MMEYYSATKKNEILPFAAMWLDLESVMLSEISQSVKDKYHMISLVWNLRNKMANKGGKKRDRTNRWLPERRWRGGGMGEKGEGD